MKTNTIAIILLFFAGQSFGQFEEPQFVHSHFSHSLESVKSGDLDNDGFEDLVFGGDFSLSWAKNLGGSGSWSSNMPIDNSYDEKRRIELLDLDEDGFLDIICLHDGNFRSWLKWYRNEGNGTFSDAILIEEYQDLVSGIRELSMGIADMDNDNKMDIVVSYAMGDNDSQKISLYRNLGTGIFDEGVIITTEINDPWYLQLIHVDNDDFIDVVVSSKGESIYVVQNIDGLSFGEPIQVTTNDDKLISMSAGDFDGDGDMDLIGGIRQPDLVVTFENIDGLLDFGEEVILLEDIDYATSFICEDLDDDNDVDILFIASNDGQTAALLNDGSGQFSEPILFDSTFSYSIISSMVLFDYDKDGDKDLMANGDDVENYFFFENIDNEFGWTFKELMSMSPKNKSQKTIYEDIDNDGFKDAIVFTEDPFDVSWMRYNPEYDLYEKMRNILSDFGNHNYLNTSIFDVDGNGLLDLVYFDKTEDAIKWLLNLGMGEFEFGGSVSCACTSIRGIEFSDLNNDSNTDLVFYGNLGTGTSLGYLLNTGDIEQSYTSVEMLISDAPISHLRILDYNGDGRMDLFPITQGAFNFGYFQGNSSGFAPFEIIQEVGYETRKTTVNDFNKDGYYDILVEGSNGVNYYQAIDSSSFSYTVLQGNSDFNSIELIDLNLDGYDDLIIEKLFTTEIYEQRYDPNTSSFEEKTLIDYGYTYNNDIKITDIDNDGDLDIGFDSNLGTFISRNIAANGKVITGAFYDLNQNGDLDIDEPFLQDFEFSITPDDVKYISSVEKQTEFFLNPGNYTLNAILKDNWVYTTNPSSFDFTMEKDSVEEKFFGYFPTELIDSVSSDITFSPTRCGFTIPIWLQVENTGTTINENIVSFYIEQYATFVESSPLPDSIENDTLYWFTNDLLPTERATIDIMLTIADVSFLGDTVKIQSKTYTVDSQDSIILQEENLFESEINCAYDPNDKIVDPPGFLDENYTLFGEDLKYTIRFQNTGTDTAFTVKITDKLDVNLDYNSFEMIGASHFVEPNIDLNTGLITFLFPNIQLPDSIVNESASHGFVKFSVSPKEGLAENTVISNIASIFFDFNSAIITNVTNNTFVSSYPISIQENISDPMCFGLAQGSIMLDVYAIEPISYEWADPSLDGAIIENITAGEYEVTVTDGTGGTKATNIILTSPPEIIPSYIITDQTSISLGSAMVQIEGGVDPYTIEWSTTPAQTGPVAEDLVEGIYHLTITDSNDCVKTDSIEVGLFVGLVNESYNWDFKLHPNPTNGIFTIVGNASTLVGSELRISDLSGRILHKTTITSSFEKYDSTSIGLSTGLYLISVVRDNQVVSKKLIIK